MSILYFPSDTNHSSKSSRELWPTKCLDIPSNWVWVFGQIQLILNGRNWAISWRSWNIFIWIIRGKTVKDHVTFMSGDSQGQNHSLDKSHRHIHFRFSLRIEIKWAVGLHLSGIYKSVWNSTPHPVIMLTSFQLSQTYIRQVNRFIHREKKRIIIAVLASSLRLSSLFGAR